MNPVTVELLWLGYEDTTGLWEVPWGAAGDERAGSGWRADLVVELMRSGLIEVVVGPAARDVEAPRRLSPDEARGALRDPASWLGPGDVDTGEDVVRYRTTDAGFAAYRAATGWTDPADAGGGTA